jgi:hypothetical protein
VSRPPAARILTTTTLATVERATTQVLSSVTLRLRPARRDWLWVAVLLAVSVVPCFWTERAGTGDLLSHVYNVWLVQQIKAGHTPGLSLATSHTNILFDLMLDYLVTWFGFGMGTKIGLATAVLIYTGGQITLWKTVAPKGWKAVSPLALMLSYGWLYAVGFINFYLALGLGYFAIALLWSAPRAQRRYIGAVALLAVAWAAHFVAVLMIMAIVIYAIVAERLATGAERLARRRMLMLFGVTAAAIGIGHVLLRVYGHEQYNFEPQWRMGAEQVWLFSDRYGWFITAIALVWVAGLARLIWRRRAELLSDRVLHIYLLVALVAVLAPWGIRWISYSVTMGLLPPRITAIAAVFGCALAARAQIDRRFAILAGILALAFFAVFYRDMREFNDAEADIEQVIHQLPTGARVVSNVDWPLGRVQMWHLIDRACIGHVYDFGNYEASSGHFRIRVQPGNTFLTWVPPDVDPVGTAVLLRGKAMPVYEIYDDDEGQYHARRLDLSAMPDVE